MIKCLFLFSIHFFLIFSAGSVKSLMNFLKTLKALNRSDLPREGNVPPAASQLRVLGYPIRLLVAILADESFIAWLYHSFRTLSANDAFGLFCLILDPLFCLWPEFSGLTPIMAHYNGWFMVSPVFFMIGDLYFSPLSWRIWSRSFMLGISQRLLFIYCHRKSFDY